MTGSARPDDRLRRVPRVACQFLTPICVTSSALCSRLIQSRKPPIDDGRRESETDGRARCWRDQIALFDQRIEHCPGLTLFVTRESGRATTRILTSHHRLAQQGPRAFLQALCTRFFFGPDLNPPEQF